MWLKLFKLPNKLLGISSGCNSLPEVFIDIDIFFYPLLPRKVESYYFFTIHNLVYIKVYSNFTSLVKT